MDKKAWHNAVGKAIHYLNDNAWNSKNNSTDYDLFYNGKLYPPKEVYKYAAEFFNDKFPEETAPILGGGKPINEFLKGLGFDVVAKREHIGHLEARLRSHFPSIWRCADSNNWNVLMQSNLLSFAWLDVNVDYRTISLAELPSGKKSIRRWVHELRKGDLIFLMDKNAFYGIAVAESEYEFNGEKVELSHGLKPAIRVYYIFKSEKKLKHNLETHNNPTTFARIDQLNFGLTKTLLFLSQRYPNVINILEEYFNTEKMNNDIEEFNDLLRKKKQIILQGPPGTGKTRLAKQIAEKLTNDNTYSIVQFHPSYSYEDFVRGMRVVNEGSQIEYVTENKIVAELADKALTNFQNHKKEASELSRENWIREQFQEFVESIQVEIDKEGKFELNKHVFIFEANDDSFRYTGTAWNSSSTGHRMKYEDLMISYFNDLHSRKAINKSELVSGSARQHATYYYYVLNRFLKFISKKDFKEDFRQAVELKNFVLIIDEINRANLSSVFGELVYALEYRGDTVQSMYDIDGKRSIILPPNLYIIGTMNTADRSVGQIDYAIRRRFAFVEVLPKTLDESTLEGKKFALEAFKKVSTLFVVNDIETESENFEPSEYLSEEFRPEDVWLGHSYFIYEDEGFFVRLKYEIVPILKEYVKDGILKESALDSINSLQYDLFE